MSQRSSALTLPSEKRPLKAQVPQSSGCHVLAQSSNAATPKQLSASPLKFKCLKFMPPCVANAMATSCAALAQIAMCCQFHGNVMSTARLRHVLHSCSIMRPARSRSG